MPSVVSFKVSGSNFKMTALAICGESKFMSQYLELAGLELSLYQDCFIP